MRVMVASRSRRRPGSARAWCECSRARQLPSLRLIRPNTRRRPPPVVLVQRHGEAGTHTAQTHGPHPRRTSQPNCRTDARPRPRPRRDPACQPVAGRLRSGPPPADPTRPPGSVFSVQYCRNQIKIIMYVVISIRSDNKIINIVNTRGSTVRWGVARGGSGGPGQVNEGAPIYQAIYREVRPPRGETAVRLRLYFEFPTQSRQATRPDLSFFKMFASTLCRPPFPPYSPACARKSPSAAKVAQLDPSAPHRSLSAASLDRPCPRRSKTRSRRDGRRSNGSRGRTSTLGTL